MCRTPAANNNTGTASRGGGTPRSSVITDANGFRDNPALEARQLMNFAKTCNKLDFGAITTSSFLTRIDPTRLTRDALNASYNSLQDEVAFYRQGVFSNTMYGMWGVGYLVKQAAPDESINPDPTITDEALQEIVNQLPLKNYRDLRQLSFFLQTEERFAMSVSIFLCLLVICPDLNS